MQKLFRKMESPVLSHWEANPAIFIRSDKDFDTVYHHLRKFTHLHEPETEKWYFFRFYDPQVLGAYLPLLSRYPANLAALFGCKKGNLTSESERYYIYIKSVTGKYHSGKN